MKTALLLTPQPAAHRQWAELLGNQIHLVVVPPPAEPNRAQFDALFATWLRLADVIVVDAAALNESSRWALEALAAATSRQPRHAIIISATALQQTIHHTAPDWLVVNDTEPAERLRPVLRGFLDSRATTAAPAPQLVPTVPVAPATESYRYRDALKTLSRVVGQRHDEPALLKEFLQFVGELFGTGKTAIFTATPAEGQALTIAVSDGIAPNVIAHLRLTAATGIGAYLTREAKILRRAQNTDLQVAREFDLLGTEVAVPMFDHDQLLGVLTFSGKITGEPWSSEELELAYSLMAQLGQALRNVRLNEQLAAQQRLVSEVLANIQTGVLVVAHDGRLLGVNPCAKQLLDLGETEVTGQRLTTLPARVADTVYEVLQTGTAVREREVVLPGSKRPLHVSATRFAANGTGQANWVVVALVDDLTQIKLQQAQARELADKEFLTRLADRLSHELKNALVSVKIHAQLLPERYQDPEFREEFSRTMVNEVNRVDVLINNLAFFSHPLGLVHEPLELGPLLDVAVKNLTQDCARRRQLQIAMFGEKPSPAAVELPMVTVKCIYQHKAGRVSGDRIRLAQAIEHLLRNAVQAMPQGGRLSVSTADATAEDFPDRQLPPGGAVRIDFQDTGEGIALENVSRVAEPFFTTRNVGVGLGLTIVKKIIERHCGELVVESTLEKGTKITLLLPVQQQPHPEDGMMNLLNETVPVTAPRRPGIGAREHAESQNPVH